MDIEQVVDLEIDLEAVPQDLEVEVQQIGPQGLSAYEVYIQNGGKLNEEEWLNSLIGSSAYEVYLEQGGNLTEKEWLNSLVGPTGPSGVYMGNTEPDDPNVNVWIDTTDDTVLLNAEGESF